MLLQVLLSLIFPFSLLCLPAPIPFFDPPAGWECAFPENSSPCIQIGFLGKGSTSFRPSINLAIEEIDVDLQQYLKAVKAIHVEEPGTTWRDLGKFKTLGGVGRLTEIATQSPLGPIKMLQMILVLEKTAYILTGASIKDDFLKFQETFIKAFQSLRVTHSLFDLLPSEKKVKFETFFSMLGKSLVDDAEKQAKWANLQALVIQEGQEMGTYWQVLVLKFGREKIYQRLSLNPRQNI
jgi:hypothetical protein